MLKTKRAIKMFVTGKLVSHKRYGVSDKATLKTEIIVYYLVQVDDKMTVIYNSFTTERNNATVSIFLLKSFSYVKIVIKRKLTLRHLNVH